MLLQALSGGSAPYLLRAGNCAIQQDFLVVEVIMDFVGFPKIAQFEKSFLCLTNGGVAICDEDDFDKLSSHSWFHVFDGNQIYAARAGDSGKLIRMHTEIMGGNPVDHINGDGLDNCRGNLRFVTNTQNQMNRGKFATGYSKYKGVSWHCRDKKWTAKIKAEGRRINLGYFTTELEAAKAYNGAALRYFKEFARLNQI